MRNVVAFMTLLIDRFPLCVDIFNAKSHRRSTYINRMINERCMAYIPRCNRLRCPLARMTGLQCFTMGHNGHGINLYGVGMTLMGN